MCQRPNCSYVHPTMASYMFKQQMKRKGKGNKGKMPFGVMSMRTGGRNGPKPPKPDDQAS